MIIYLYLRHVVFYNYMTNGISDNYADKMYAWYNTLPGH